MKHRMVTTLLAVLLAGSVSAEFRIWTGATGSQLKAELVEEAGGKVVLRDETGRQIKVPRSYLGKADLAYLDSRTVPVLGIKSDIKVHSEYRKGPGVVQMVKYSIEIRKVSSDPYPQPVGVVMYLIGTVGKESTYMVLQRTEEMVRFTKTSRNPGITGPDLFLGSPELQKKYDVEYVGYLIMVTSPAGQVIKVESDVKLLEANAGFIGKFKAGDLFGENMKLLE